MLIPLAILSRWL